MRRSLLTLTLVVGCAGTQKPLTLPPIKAPWTSPAAGVRVQKKVIRPLVKLTERIEGHYLLVSVKPAGQCEFVEQRIQPIPATEKPAKKASRNRRMSLGNMMKSMTGTGEYHCPAKGDELFKSGEQFGCIHIVDQKVRRGDCGDQGLPKGYHVNLLYPGFIGAGILAGAGVTNGVSRLDLSPANNKGIASTKIVSALLGGKKLYLQVLDPNNRVVRIVTPKGDDDSSLVTSPLTKIPAVGAYQAKLKREEEERFRVAEEARAKQRAEQERKEKERAEKEAARIAKIAAWWNSNSATTFLKAHASYQKAMKTVSAAYNKSNKRRLAAAVKKALPRLRQMEKAACTGTNATVPWKSRRQAYEAPIIMYQDGKPIFEKSKTSPDDLCIQVKKWLIAYTQHTKTPREYAEAVFRSQRVTEEWFRRAKARTANSRSSSSPQCPSSGYSNFLSHRTRLECARACSLCARDCANECRNTYFNKPREQLVCGRTRCRANCNSLCSSKPAR